MVSPTEENYLKALYTLANEGEGINVSDLGQALEVSTPTVNSMVKKLHAKQLVAYEKYKPIVLTAEGRKKAALIIRKHRLTEMYLVEKMGFGWEEVHEIAEQIEHIQSPAFFDKMDALLAFPALDPHGSPIPDKNGLVQQKPLQKLSTCTAGSNLRLEALAHSSSEFLKFLNSKGLSLGVVMEVVSVEPYDGSMVVHYDQHPAQALSQTVCDKLLVEKVSDHKAKTR